MKWYNVAPPIVVLRVAIITELIGISAVAGGIGFELATKADVGFVITSGASRIRRPARSLR